MIIIHVQRHGPEVRATARLLDYSVVPSRSLELVSIAIEHPGRSGARTVLYAVLSALGDQLREYASHDMGADVDRDDLVPPPTLGVGDVVDPD